MRSGEGENDRYCVDSSQGICADVRGAQEEGETILDRGGVKLVSRLFSRHRR